MKDFIKGIVLPPYWRYSSGTIETADFVGESTDEIVLTNVSSCPLYIKLTSESDNKWWMFPMEPVIAVNGKNNIIRRDILKVLDGDSQRRGSVKELWSQDDYEVNISGVFRSFNGELPIKDISKLRGMCEARETIDVKSELLIKFGIERIAIEDFQFPFTKGMENQIFSIKAYSDNFDVDKLLVKE